MNGAEQLVAPEWPAGEGEDRAVVDGYRHPVDWHSPFEPMSVPELLERGTMIAGERKLCDFYGRRFSYRAIRAEARRIAAALQSAGIGPGDRIGLFLPNVPLYISAYYGVMIAGATVINFSPLYTADELSAQVEDSGARMLFTVDSAELLPTAREVLDRSGLQALVVGRLADMLPRAKSLLLRLLRRRTLAPIPHDDRQIMGMAEFLAGAGEPSPVVIDPLQDVALLQYTGGTTGRPKGAMLTHQNLTVNARQVLRVDAHRGERDIIIGALPFFHVFANTVVLNRTVLDGGMIVMLPRFNAREVLDAVARVRATSLPGVPTMYQALLDCPAIERTDFSSLRMCISGGAPLPLPLKRRFEDATGARLIEGYGLTESAGVVSTNPFEGENTAKPGTIGQALPGTRIRLLDKEDPGRLAEPGVPGELAVSGPQIMRGYWNRSDGSSVFADGYLRTGDIATIDADGFIAIVDRIKDMISVGGFKVFPSQIEEILLQRPEVREALVIGVPDDYRGESPMAFVTLSGDATSDGDDLRDWVNARLGKHERVIGVEVRAELPKTMIGKLDRKALRAELEKAKPAG